jgi:hypothetical protein
VESPEGVAPRAPEDLERIARKAAKNSHWKIQKSGHSVFFSIQKIYFTVILS